MKRILLVLLIMFMSTFIVFAQKNSNEKMADVKYRRSSLHTILIESDKFPYKDAVINAYNNAPFPDKYNNHNIGEKSFDPYKYGTPTSDTSGYKGIIDKYLIQNKIANKVVAKWFNRQEDGTFDMNLVGERGSYNASEMDVRIAKNSARGVALLADAGEELISNTFVVVSKLFFVSNEIAAAAIRKGAILAANEISNSLLRSVALKAADVAYEKGKEGYSVWTTSYLYRLAWNDSIAAVFYNELWMDKINPDPARKAKFDNTDLFRLDYIGYERSSSLVTFSLKEKRSEEKIVEISTIRNIDAVYAKLQKKYDVFKTKTPLFTGYPITAKIGLKEGLEAGDRYEVLEQVMDDSGKTKYVRKGTIKVEKGQIWDNRFTEGDEKADPKQKIDRTFFEGGKDYYPGMLIRQIK
jgi:hypothetical protein